MNNALRKTAIGKVTGLQVGFTDQFVVMENGAWRALSAAENTAVDTEYDLLYKDSLVPKVITPRQARLALLQATLLDDVELLLANDKAMQIWWEYSLDIQRNHPHITAMTAAMGMTETQMDELFVLAGSL